MTFRGYFQLSGDDASQLATQVAQQHERVRDRLREVGSVVAVVSGKGGVGKSYVTSALALALARCGATIGVLDADLQSPTAARMLGARGPLAVDGDAVLARPLGGIESGVGVREELVAPAGVSGKGGDAGRDGREGVPAAVLAQRRPNPLDQGRVIGADGGPQRLQIHRV